MRDMLFFAQALFSLLATSCASKPLCPDIAQWRTSWKRQQPPTTWSKESQWHPTSMQDGFKRRAEQRLVVFYFPIHSQELQRVAKNYKNWFKPRVAKSCQELDSIQELQRDAKNYDKNWFPRTCKDLHRFHKSCKRFHPLFRNVGASLWCPGDDPPWRVPVLCWAARATWRDTEVWWNPGIWQVVAWWTFLGFVGDSWG